jgi:hypothetical protein
MIKLDLVEKIPNFLRWILIPIVSVLAYLITSVLVNVGGTILTFLSMERGGWGQNFWTYLASPGLSGFVAVYSSAILAPKAKRGTAILVFAIWLVLAGGIAALSVFQRDWPQMLAVVSTIVGCGAAFFGVQEEVKREALYCDS